MHMAVAHRHDRLEMQLQPVLAQKGISTQPAKIVAAVMPPKPEATKFSAKDVLALKGDAEKGKQLAARCLMCHKIDGNGSDYGPDLKGFGQRQPADVVARSIVDPSFDISHGFDGHTLVLNDGKRIDGLILSQGRTVSIRSTGGLDQEIPRKEIRENKLLEQSLMLSADQLGLSAQDVADIVEWMKGY